MKKILTLLIALTLSLCLAGPIWAVNGQRIYIDAYRDQGYQLHGGQPGTLLTSANASVAYLVLESGTQTVATIYDSADAAMNNPVAPDTWADATGRAGYAGAVDFYIDYGSYSAVDIVLVSLLDNGIWSFVDYVGTTGVSTTYNDIRRVVFDDRPGRMQHGMIFYSATCCGWWDPDDSQGEWSKRNTTTSADGGMVHTGVVLQDGTVIHDMWIEVLQATAASDIAIRVGGGSAAEGDIDGFLGGCATGNGGVNIDGVLVHAEGNTQYRVSAAYDSYYYGDFFYHSIGDDTMSAEDGTADASLYWTGPRIPYYIHDDHSLSYTVNSGMEGNFDTAGWGLIHWWFTRSRR